MIIDTTRKTFLATSCVALLFFLGIATGHAAIRVEASVRNPVMVMGESNAYSITLHNASNPSRLPTPRVPGLVFNENPSVQQSHNIINGAVSMESRFTWSFQPERPGRHVIPEREIEIGGQRLRTQAVTVEVREMPTEMRNRFALRWKVPEGPFYVGQAIPATLQLYVRSGIPAGIGSGPEGSSEQFIQSEFSQEPRQRQAVLDGQTYTVVEWNTVITPIRPGLGTLPISVVLVYETGEVQRGFFGNQAVRDQIRLTTADAEWTILELPQAGRPDSFSGAVGDFEVQARLSRTELNIGDPITLSLEVSGEGNFDRIQAPPFPETDGWRIYPPRAQMKEEEPPNRGVKTFEYILSPTTDAVRESPPIAFSWFNPEEKAWREIEIDPTPVEIHPGTGSTARARPAKGGDGDSYLDSGGDQLFAIAASPGRHQTLQPAWSQPAFWVFNGGLGCAMAVLLFGMARQRKAASNPYLQVRSEAARRAKNFATEAIQAAERNDASGFYTQARQALRHFLAILDPRLRNPDSLTWDDLEAILKDSSFDADALERMRELFRRKDAIEFAGWKPTPEEIASDRTVFEALLNQIVTRKR